MRLEKVEATKLRKQGNSYNQISAILNVPKSTLSDWLKDIKLSSQAQAKIQKRVNDTSIKALIKRNINQTKLAETRNRDIRQQAKKDFVKFNKVNKSSLQTAGVLLYWAEGYKRGALGAKSRGVDFTNADPKMLKLMYKFFLKTCGISKEKIRVQVAVHHGMNQQKVVDYWSKYLSIDKNNFTKVMVAKDKSTKKTNRLMHGTVHLRFNDVKTLYKIMGWLDGLQECYGL